MPTYDFQCSKCSKIVEAVRRVDERDDAPKCECGAETKRVMISAPGVILRGSGWTPKFHGS